MKVKLNLVEVQITEKNLEIKLLFEKLELALSTIFKEEFKKNGDTTMEDEQEKSPEINAANSQGSPACNDEEEKSGKKKKNKKKNKDKNDENNSADKNSEEKENLVVTVTFFLISIILGWWPNLLIALFTGSERSFTSSSKPLFSLICRDKIRR